jgi:hypothetical protein
VVKHFVDELDTPGGPPMLEYIMSVHPDHDQRPYWGPVQAAAATGNLDILEHLLSRLAVLREEVPNDWN